MFVVSIILAVAFGVLFLLELSESKIYKAVTAAISTLSAIVAIVSLVHPGSIEDSQMPSENESTTYYRYREMEYTTSTSPELVGWELCDTIPSENYIGEWSPWQYEYVEATGTREVQTETHYRYREITTTIEYSPWSDWTTERRDNVTTNTQEETRSVPWYGYYYFECPNCHAHMHGWNITCPVWAGGCGNAYIPENSWHQLQSETSWDEANLKDWHGTGKYYTYIDGVLYFKWDDTYGQYDQYRYREHSETQNATEWSPYTNQIILNAEGIEVQQATAYRYRERAETTIYRFCRWGEWSDWSETKREPSDTVQVESIVR